MAVTRRSLLLGSLSLAALTAMSRYSATSNALVNPGIVVVTGTDPETDPVRLATLLQPFTLRRIPITVSVAPFGDVGQAGLNPALIALLRKSIDQDADSLEVAIDLGKIEPTDPYFQLRQASTAQAAFSHLMNPVADQSRERLVTGLTATTTTPVRLSQDFLALRAAGIRTLIHLESSEPVATSIQAPEGGYLMTDTGLANLFGRHLRPAKPSKTGSAQRLQPQVTASDLLWTGADAGQPIVIQIAFDLLAMIGDGELAGYATDLAHAISQSADKQLVRPVTPWTLYAQSRPDAARYVILRVDDFRANQADDDAHQQFVAALLEQEYPLTEGVVPAGGNLLAVDTVGKAQLQAFRGKTGFDVALQGWNHAPNEGLGNRIDQDADQVLKGVNQLLLAVETLPSSYIPTNNSYDGNLLDAVGAAGISMFSAQKGDYSWFAGMDKRGVLHLSNTVAFEADWSGSVPYLTVEELLARIGDRNDTVFAINPRTATTPEKRRAILEALAALSAQRGTKLVNFEGYYRAVVPRMTKLETIRSAKAEVQVRDARPANINAVTEDQLLGDAALAWQYFGWGPSKFNGMVPGTVWMEYGQKAGYPFGTQWDFGSYILATISAHRLKIIDQPQFETTIKTILKFIGQSAYRFRGIRLPDVERALGTARPNRRGFDSADTGRLLMAFSVLENYAPKAFPVAKLVAGWGLNTIIADGVMHSVSGGKLVVNASRLSYSHYARRGYLAWGYDISPIFDDAVADMDGAVGFLNEIQSRGRIATEPTITEEIEAGGTEATRLLADVLYAAQINRYRDTGILTCASEGPIDGPPYFSYQGYQLTPSGGEFVVDARTADQKTYVDKMGSALRMVSTKGCFLWHATRPGEYSNKLISLARQTGRIEGIGFASGIHESMGVATALSDVNTNGLILESIAFILNGRRPLSELGRSD